MYSKLNEFKKTKDHLVAIDSDGCVFDTMTLKHQQFFYPLLEEELELQEWGEELGKKWNCINLYSSMRGINRFESVYHLFKDVNDKVLPMSDKTKIYNKFIRTNRTINVEDLEVLYKETGDDFVGHIIDWSKKVNKEIESKMQRIDAFKESVVTIREIAKFADIAVVSSANEQALIDEWGSAELLDYVSVLTSQSDGKKEAILEKLIAKGYNEKRVLMIGDSLGDRHAATVNEASFRLIEAPYEEKSWKNIRREMENGGLFNYELKI